MEFSPADGPQISEPSENNYEHKVDILDEWWDSISDIGLSNATGHQILPEPTTVALGSTPPSSNDRGELSSLHPLSNPYSSGTRSSYQANQLPTEFVDTFHFQSAAHSSGPSDTLSSSTFDINSPYDLLGAIGIESAGHESGPDNTTPPDRSNGFRYGLEQQSETPSRLAETSRYDARYGNLLLGFDGSSLHGQRGPELSDALAVNRAGCFTSDSSAKPYFYSAEDHRPAQQRNAIYLDDYEETLVRNLSDPSLVWRHEHRLGALSTSEPTSPSSLSPKDSSPASASTIPSTSATTTLPSGDNWNCDTCGRVLATKGTRNRNRNKRRHRCPGTGRKYPCQICSKSFNRGDTRLLHLRKWHPEVYTEPPRPRKRKNQ